MILERFLLIHSCNTRFFSVAPLPQKKKNFAILHWFSIRTLQQVVTLKENHSFFSELFGVSCIVVKPTVSIIKINTCVYTPQTFTLNCTYIGTVVQVSVWYLKFNLIFIIIRRPLFYYFKNNGSIYNLNSGIIINMSCWKIYYVRSYILFFNIEIIDASSSKGRGTDSLISTMLFKEQEFDWDPALQGYILSSFFYGYITTQLFGGWLSAKIGGKRVFAFGIAITSILTLITPFLVYASVYLLLVVRIVEGIFEVSIPKSRSSFNSTYDTRQNVFYFK